jgi:hypothetical protein
MVSSKVSSRSREKVLGDLRIGRILSNGKGATWVIYLSAWKECSEMFAEKASKSSPYGGGALLSQRICYPMRNRGREPTIILPLSS